MAMVTAAIAFVNTFGYGDAMDQKKNRTSWLEAGLSALASDGPDGLRITAIAQRLGVTKGSFYWHFKNLEEYQSALLEEWAQGHTQDAIACVEGMGGDAASKLRKWFIGSVAADFTLARAIRSWSLNNQHACAIQARVDQRRIDYLDKLLRDAGWKKDQATTLGHWAYWAWVGYSTLDGPRVTEQQVDLILSFLQPR
jgi:AcrR family transcriptional regulator